MSPDPETAETPAIEHEPPSLPASPHHKRTRIIDPGPGSAAASLIPDSGTSTPTPLIANVMATHHASAPLRPGSAVQELQPRLQVELLSENARAPTKGSKHAAGHDLYSAKAVLIPARGRALVPTDIKISCPAGTYGRVAPRSGLAYKHGIDTMAGVIDADYRGPVGVILANLSDEDFQVNIGDRIAQLVLERIYTPEIEVVDKLDDTVRGAGGFGSTGGFGGVLSATNGA